MATRKRPNLEHWLSQTRRTADERRLVIQEKDITSPVGTAVVGNQDIFMFVDTCPDLNVWAAAATALDSEAARELEDMFSTVSECSENSLWKFEASE